MKTQYGFSIILIGGLLLFALGAYYIDSFGLMWVILVIAGLAFLAIKNKKLAIDMNRKEIHAKAGLIHPAATFPIDKIQRFELFTMSTNFIKTSTALNVYYLDNNGKEKSAQIAQGFTTSEMQKVLNEMEEILENHAIKG